MNNQLLNIATSVSWQDSISEQQCSEKIRSWLLDESSLTKKLEQQCQAFSVQVKQEIYTNKQCAPLSSHFKQTDSVLVREVLLHCDQVAHVFAQTEIPQTTLAATQQNLSELGNQSLGNVLFQHARLQRGPIEVAELPVDSPVHHFITSLQQTCEHTLWARRSLFFLGSHPLLVSEVFLPASGIYS